MLKRIFHFLFGKDDAPVRRTVWSENLVLPTVKEERSKAASNIPRPATWTLPSGDVVEFD